MNSYKYLLIFLAGLFRVHSAVAQRSLQANHGLRDIVEHKWPEEFVHTGGTIAQTELDTPLGAVLNREFSYITPENDFKQHGVHPSPGRWNWKRADAWIESARENNQVIRIHGPVSPQCSKWAKEDSRTAEELLQNMEEYMTALCQRYNDEPEVIWLDVVNETIDLRGAGLVLKRGPTVGRTLGPKLDLKGIFPTSFPSSRSMVVCRSILSALLKLPANTPITWS